MTRHSRQLASSKPALPLPPNDVEPQFVDRPGAAAWFAARGFTNMTGRQLRKLAEQGKGPPYSRLGKFAFYRREDLTSWLQENLRPATAGRTKSPLGEESI